MLLSIFGVAAIRFMLAAHCFVGLHAVFHTVDEDIGRDQNIDLFVKFFVWGIVPLRWPSSVSAM